MLENHYMRQTSKWMQCYNTTK